MKIKRFYESIEDDFLLTIKDYFASFTEDLDDVCNIYFNKVNDNLFELSISFINNITSVISNETDLTKLDNWIDKNEIDNIILKELRASMQVLVNDNMLEEFKVTKNTWGYTIEINTTIKGEVTDWCYVNADNIITYDKNRFKKAMLDRFEVEVVSDMREEYDRSEDRYLEFTVTFKSSINDEMLVEIKKYILNTECEIQGNLEKVFIDTHWKSYYEYS